MPFPAEAHSPVDAQTAAINGALGSFSRPFCHQFSTNDNRLDTKKERALMAHAPYKMFKGLSV